MNSRSGVNESSLVNFSTDLPSLDAKDSLLSFPFDHLYACHSDSSDQRDGLQANKEVDLAAQCVIGEDKNLGVSGSTEVEQLNDRLNASEIQNKRLKDLLIYHLDLIQQQNELITRRDKLFQALRHENESLKTKLHRRHGLILPPPPPPPPVLLPPPPPPPPPTTTPQTSLPPPPAPLPANSTVVKSDGSQVMLDNLELMLPEKRSSTYMFDTDLSKPKKFEKETFGIARTSTVTEPDTKTFVAGDLGVPTTLESKPKYSSMRCEGFKPIDSKRSLIKKDALKTEPRSEALYTVTTNSGNPVIQRVQRTRKRGSTGVGHLSRMAKTPKVEAPEPTKAADEPTFDHFGINKKNKFINTYGKSKTATTSTATSTTSTMPKRSTFGSLSERLQLIDTTPTGEDPYQLGEADLREQSPIPKLMLQKTNHGRMKVLDQPTRRIYDPDSPEPKTPRGRSNRFLSSTFTADLKKEAKTMVIQEPDLDLVKTEPEINWRIYSPKFKTAIETCTSATPPLPINSTLNLEELNVGSGFNAEKEEEKSATEQTEVQHDLEMSQSFIATLISSTVGQSQQTNEESQTGTYEQEAQEGRDRSMDFTDIDPALSTPSRESKRGRKRAHSTAGLGRGGKGAKAPAKPRGARGRGGATRGKKTPPPGRTTQDVYFTHVGDIDLSWYQGLDTDMKLDNLDIQPLEDPTVGVEVPRWREMPFTTLYTLEGTELVEDRVFEKRHQKLEAEERRQLRWHMRRIREQRHVEKLRQRQRDSWSTVAPPSVYTVWPRPQRDARLIEITDTLPVTAFGEAVPDLRETDFMLPWVRTSKALKRSKRSKTLH